MKKTILISATVIFLSACNNHDTEETSTNAMASDTSAMVSPAPATPDVTVPSATDNTRTAYLPAEGDVSYRNGKLMVWKNNDYVIADNDMNFDGGIMVKRNGEVTRNGKLVKLQEGESVSKTGKFFNKAGEGIEDAWKATKKGVGKAADAIKDAVH